LPWVVPLPRPEGAPAFGRKADEWKFWGRGGHLGEGGAF